MVLVLFHVPILTDSCFECSFYLERAFPAFKEFMVNFIYIYCILWIEKNKKVYAYSVANRKKQTRYMASLFAVSISKKEYSIKDTVTIKKQQ